MITINHYFTEYTGQPSREEWALFNGAMPAARPAKSEREALAQAAAIYFESNGYNRSQWFTKRWNAKYAYDAWYVTIVDVATGATSEKELTLNPEQAGGSVGKP